MFTRSTVLAQIGGIVLSGMLLTPLIGQDCAAQSDPCNPDPCEGIENAVAGTCTPVGGGPCAPATDFFCSCYSYYHWQDATNTCEGGPCIDNDADDFGSPGGSPYCTYPEEDCDDGNADVYPGAPELCDGIDNQCIGDEGYGEVDEVHDGMACIPAGCFNMGDAFSEGDSDELPVHYVCISAFEMDVLEVTNAEYADCVGAGGCTRPQYVGSETRTSYYGNAEYDSFPVIWVSHYMARSYCTWVGKRLPTEAEWEYAARGGLPGKRYPWGDTISGSDANFAYSGDPWDNDTSEVGYYAPNGYGLYDMAGNVREWVSDEYVWNYYAVSPQNDPPGPISGTYRGVQRGGGFNDSPTDLRVANRFNTAMDSIYFQGGFRCVRGGAYGP